MKSHVPIFFLFFLFHAVSFGQPKTEKHPSVLDIHFFLNDFKTRQIVARPGDMDPGIGVTYIKGLGKQIDWMFTLNGSFPDSAVKGKTDHQKSLLTEAQSAIRARLIKGLRSVQPFLSAGMGFTAYDKNYDVFFAPGAGLQIQYKSIYFLFNLQYHAAVTSRLNDHFYYSLGIGGELSHHQTKTKPKRIVQSPLVSVLIDRDGDGIYDSTDACPDIPGLLAFAGCPDTDGDGIADKDDQCPSVYGVIRYHGCPPPDKDGDGINDEEDICPETPGFIKYKGCPIPDTDGDGINDEEDRCVTIPGIRENFGCPAIENELVEQFNKAAANVFFKTGSFELLPASFKALDEVMNLLKIHATLHLMIGGHTDSIGKADANQLLSEQRANTVLGYFKSKGIDPGRLQSAGFGSAKPKTENNTSKGRAANRRVEFKLKYADK
jgi:OmpA-OmpF porin, OOP family